MPQFIQNLTTEVNITVQDIIELLVAKYPEKFAGTTFVSGDIFVPDVDFDLILDATTRRSIKNNTVLKLKVMGISE